MIWKPLMENLKSKLKDNSLISLVIEEKANNMTGTTEDIDTIYSISKDIWESLFDNDVFARVYSLANESSISCLLFAIQMIKGLLEEVGNTYKEDKLLKYLED